MYHDDIQIVHFRGPLVLQTLSSLISLAVHSQQYFLHPFHESHTSDLTLHNSYCITFLIVENFEKMKIRIP